MILVVGAAMALHSCTQQSCETITCHNGGECVDGKCNCTERYKGEFCFEQKQPTAIIINKVVVKDFAHPTIYPPYDNLDFDERYGGPGPDLAIRISQSTGFIFGSFEFYVDGSQNTTYTFTQGFPVRLEALDEDHRLDLVDQDEGSLYDNVAKIYFDPLDASINFPKVFKLKESDATNGHRFIVDLHVSYEF